MNCAIALRHYKWTFIYRNLLTSWFTIRLSVTCTMCMRIYVIKLYFAGIYPRNILINTFYQIWCLFSRNKTFSFLLRNEWHILYMLHFIYSYINLLIYKICISVFTWNIKKKSANQYRASLEKERYEKPYRTSATFRATNFVCSQDRNGTEWLLCTINSFAADMTRIKNEKRENLERVIERCAK